MLVLPTLAAFAPFAILAAATPFGLSPATSKRQVPATITWFASDSSYFTSSTVPQTWEGTASAAYSMWFDTDGNLVAYKTINGVTTAEWSTPYTAAHDCSSANCQAIFQNDGNFVIYVNGAATWNTNTAGRGSTLHMNPEVQPYVVIRDAGANIIWTSGTAAVCDANCP